MIDDASFLTPLRNDLADLAGQGLLRRRRVIQARGAGRITVDGRQRIDFASNDYLGLANHPEVIAAARDAAEKWGWGAGASPLVTGYTQAHADLEAALADFEGTEGAIVFQSGFAANLGVLAALAQPGDLILSERRNHASLIDGCRLSRATVRLFDGRHLDQIPPLLLDGATFRRRLLVTDSVFSMDGDIAPLEALADLAERFDALLYVDEAHATGVLGKNGRGACEASGVEHRVALRMGTLSKGVGSVGGFVAGPRVLIDWLVNRVRPYIYSTNIPPVAAVASQKGLELIRREPERRLGLESSLNLLLKEATRLGWSTGRSTTQIIPIILGEPAHALAMAEHLADHGFWCPAIRPPTVPTGQSRLRLSLTTHHKSNDILELLHCLDSFPGRLPRSGGAVFSAGEPKSLRSV